MKAFSFVNALLILPLPFRDPAQLVEIRSMRGAQAGNTPVWRSSQFRIAYQFSIASPLHTGGSHTGTIADLLRQIPWIGVTQRTRMLMRLLLRSRSSQKAAGSKCSVVGSRGTVALQTPSAVTRTSTSSSGVSFSDTRRGN